jgi:hypothetical protein
VGWHIFDADAVGGTELRWLWQRAGATELQQPGRQVGRSAGRQVGRSAGRQVGSPAHLQSQPKPRDLGQGRIVSGGNPFEPETQAVHEELKHGRQLVAVQDHLGLGLGLGVQGFGVQGLVVQVLGALSWRSGQRSPLATCAALPPTPREERS